MNSKPPTETKGKTGPRNRDSLIFTLLNRFQLEATPANFELFHEMVTGNNPELRERFNKLGKDISPSDIEALAREFLPHHFGDSIFDHSATVMRDDLHDLMRSLKDTRSDLSSYSDNLSATSERIGKIDPADPAAIKRELASIQVLTDMQRAKSEAILETLDLKLASVNNLSSEIDHAEVAKFTHVATGLANRRAFNKRMAELYAIEKFPGDHTLIFGKIRGYEALAGPEMQKARDFLLERIGKAAGSIVSHDDLAAWIENPNLALVLATADEAEIERLSNIVREQFIAAFRTVQRSAPHLPAMMIYFGAATTYSAQKAANLIANAEQALNHALASAVLKTVIYGSSKAPEEGDKYHLYGRSVTM